MKRAALLILVLMLAACGKPAHVDSGGAFTDTRIPPSVSPSLWPPAGWAWGILQPTGKPALRYGVAAPVGEPYADVIILPGYGESAETWFETAKNLIAADYTVWILEAAGQGGSGRYGKPRDIADAPDFDADIKGLLLFKERIVRPAPNRPVAVIASRTADLVALAAVERGLKPSILILSQPMEFTPAHGGPWKRPDPAVKETPRQKAAAAWALANPDLRLGGASPAWFKAREKLSNETFTRLDSVKISVLALSTRRDAFNCTRIKACLQFIKPADAPYPLANDAVRDPWLAAIREALPH